VTVPRTDPPFGADERASYDAWLEYHRATLLLKCDGLDAEQLRSNPVGSSLMSLHGLVRHMAEVERNWFRKVIGGEELGLGIWWDDEHPDGDFEIAGDDTFEADLSVWQEQVDLARSIAAAHPLDATGTRSNGDVVDLRWVYVHMIEEYARHNGHADLLRELLDGSTGE
jgi:uncharacterized damage-inducible protein DinB